MIDNKPIFQSKIPIAFFVGLAIFLYLLIDCAIKIDFPDSLLYPTIVFVLWFMTISRFSGRLIIYQDRVEIKYLGFWHSDKEVLLSDKNQMKIKLSFWSFSNRYDSTMFKGHVFFDTISFIDKNGNVESIQINTRLGQFNKSIDIIENQIKNNR